VGRVPELEALVGAFGSVRRGRGSLFLVSGEPGIGKTRLAEEVARLAESEGMTVVWGSAWDGGGAPTYWPWIQILRALRGVVPEPGDALQRDLGPLWTDSVEAREEDAEAREFRRYDALRAVLAAAADRAPLVVVLDDLHAADRGTLAALHFLSRGIRAVPMLVVGTHRDAEARLRPEIGGLLERVAREGTRLLLRRLAREDVAKLTEDLEPVPPESVDRIYETSGGNPFFAKEVLRLVRSGAGAKRIPDAVRAVVAERLGALDAKTRDALEAAAVVGREVSLEVLASVSEFPRHALEEALEGAVLSGLLERLDDARYAFAHPLFRESLYHGAGTARRCRLHLRAADTLSRLASTSHGHAESVARHLLLALPEGSPTRASEQARSSARGCVLELAFDRAVELLEGALAALGDSADDAVRSDIELDLAETLVLVGEGERSRRICASVAERAREHADAARLARAALVYGTEIRIAVVDPLQIGLLENALELLGPAELALRAKVLARLAGARQPNPDPQSPVRQAFDAIALARSTNDPDVLLHALHTGGAALTGYAPPARRRDVSSELATLAHARKDFVRAQRGYARWAIDAAELGDSEEMLHAIRAEERLGRMLGHARFRWQSALLGSMRALVEGRWADSERWIEQARRTIADLDDPTATSVLSLHRMCAVRARMRPPDEFPPDDSQFGSDAVLARSMRQLGTVSFHARMGDELAARSAFEQALPLPAFLPLIPSAVALAVEAAVRVGHVAETRKFLPHLEALPFPAVTWGASAFIWEGFVVDLVGRSHVVLGNFDAAVLELERAVVAAELFGARPAAVDSKIALAEALLRRASNRDAERAVRLLDEAESAGRELDLGGPLRRIETLRLGLPARETSPTPRNERSEQPRLTLEREGEVWRFTSGGRSARLKHSRAFEMLKQLVDHPNREFHVLELTTAVAPDAIIDRGDSGALVDSQAAAAYRKRASELRAELDEASRWNDPARRERAQAELEFLEEELSRSVGMRGKPRRGTHAAERARVNVHKRLKGALRRLTPELPELAEHLEVSIKTGFFVVYRPR
jgi:hypothetical protein